MGIQDDDLSLADHAEMWARENGETVSLQDTVAWNAMYERWIEFAFEDFESEATR